MNARNLIVIEIFVESCYKCKLHHHSCFSIDEELAISVAIPYLPLIRSPLPYFLYLVSNLVRSLPFERQNRVPLATSLISSQH